MAGLPALLMAAIIVSRIGKAHHPMLHVEAHAFNRQPRQLPGQMRLGIVIHENRNGSFLLASRAFRSKLCVANYYPAFICSTATCQQFIHRGGESGDPTARPSWRRNLS